VFDCNFTYIHNPIQLNGDGSTESYIRYSDSLRAGRFGDRIPVGARFSAPDQAGPGTHPASYTTGYRVFPGGKAAEAWR